MKFTLIHKRDYSIQDKKTGEQITGLIYTGFAADGQVLQFSSKAEHQIFTDAIKFELERSEEIAVAPKVFNGKLKWREDLPF